MTLTLAIGGCVPTNVEQPITEAIGAFADPIGVLTIPPSTTRALTYAETDASDRALHASMKGGVTPITLAVAASANVPLGSVTDGRPARAADPRLKRWLNKVAESGGKVYSCATRPDESGIWGLAQLLASIFTPMLTDYLTYRPASAYHAVVFYDPQTDLVRQVKYVTRTSLGGGDLSCETASQL